MKHYITLKQGREKKKHYENFPVATLLYPKQIREAAIILYHFARTGDDIADEGNYLLDNVLIKDLTETIAANYRNRFLGFVFQSFNLINYKNAIENVALPLYYQGLKRKIRQQKALEYLKKVGLKDWAKHLPSELSGGQKQRVAIARAMASEPKVLLADEPTGALDSNRSNEVMSLIQKINKDGKTILVVTHEIEIAQMCKRIITLKDGVIVEDKKIDQILLEDYV